MRHLARSIRKKIATPITRLSIGLLAISLLASSTGHGAGLYDLIQSTQRQIKPSKKFINTIVNGEDISHDTLGNGQGFVAQIEVDLNESGDYYKCMGVAIATDMVLTAGHCVRRSDKNIRVKFISNLDPLDYETIPVKDYRMHPLTNAGHKGKMYAEFDEDVSEQYHDLAVLYLESPSIYAVPITVVPREFAAEKLNQHAFYVFGRGRDDIYQDKGNIEFAGLNKLVPMRSGPNYYRAYLDILPESVPQMVCVGDSGAPVTISAMDEYIPGRNVHYLVGIFVLQIIPVPPKDMKKALKVWKKAENIPTCGMALGYVNIQESVQWIEEKMNELDPENYRQLQVFGRDDADTTY